MSMHSKERTLKAFPSGTKILHHFFGLTSTCLALSGQPLPPCRHGKGARQLPYVHSDLQLWSRGSTRDRELCPLFCRAPRNPSRTELGDTISCQFLLARLLHATVIRKTKIQVSLFKKENKQTVCKSYFCHERGT